MLSIAVVAVAGRRLKRAVGGWIDGLVADEFVATLGGLAFALVGGGTTPAIRALLVSSLHAAWHVGDRPVLYRSDRNVLSIGLIFSVRCSCMHARNKKWVSGCKAMDVESEEGWPLRGRGESRRASIRTRLVFRLPMVDRNYGGGERERKILIHVGRGWSPLMRVFKVGLIIWSYTYHLFPQNGDLDTGGHILEHYDHLQSPTWLPAG